MPCGDNVNCHHKKIFSFTLIITTKVGTKIFCDDKNIFFVTIFIATKVPFSTSNYTMCNYFPFLDTKFDLYVISKTILIYLF